MNDSVTVRYVRRRYSWKGSGPIVRARVRVRCLRRCTLVIGFRFELGSVCNVRVSAILGLGCTIFVELTIKAF